MFRRSDSHRFAQHFSKVVSVIKPTVTQPVEVTPNPIVEQLPLNPSHSTSDTVTDEPSVEICPLEEVVESVTESTVEQRCQSPVSVKDIEIFEIPTCLFSESDTSIQPIHEVYQNNNEVISGVNPIARLKAVANLIKAKSDYDRLFKRQKIHL